MQEITLKIPDRHFKYFKESNLEPSEIVSEALDNYFLKGKNHSSARLNEWQNLIEKKLCELQIQIDEHRLHSGDDSFIDLDSEVKERINGKKDPLECEGFSSNRWKSGRSQPTKKPSSLTNKTTHRSSKNIQELGVGDIPI